MPQGPRDPDDEFSPRFGRGRFGSPPSPWWRPAGKTGRVLLGLGVLAILIGVAAGIVAFKTYLGRDSRFRIAGTENIEAIGLTQVSRSEMLPVFGEDIGRNIFFVPLHERRKQLEAIPWVEHATVMRLLPDQIRVSIVERQPIAFVRLGQQIGLVDKEGVLLTMPPASMAQHRYSFPVVTGIDPADPPALRRARMAVYQRILSELDANNQNLSQQISEIDLTDPQDARVLLPEQGMDILAHLGGDHFLDRYQRYKTHIAEWRQQYPKLAAVDLRYENQVVLEMTPGASQVTAAVDTSSPPPAAASSAVAATSGSASKASPAKPAPAKHVADQPVASSKADAQVKPRVQHTVAKASTPAKPGSAHKKAPTPEMLAAAQRKSRQERAARERAAHEKAEKEKKHAAATHTAQNRTKPSTHSAAAAAQGQ